MHYGIESRLADTFTIRTGWARERFTLGLTAAFPALTLDYALSASSAVGSGDAIQMVGIRIGGE